ncbi:MAG: [protein-PII] uridylyltransferase [Gammaproteobacteria bacterium]|nr:[protein-PII] uridylyltransferase [Gammaproteobacteria bacterium]
MRRLSHAELLDPNWLAPAHSGQQAALGAFREALQHGRTVLAEHHLEGGSPAALVKYHGWLVDQILAACWRRFCAPQPGGEAPSLVAVGGYGRFELNLNSDIDLLVLLPRRAGAHNSRNIEAWVRWCWDIGLNAGHSVRSVAQCVAQARGNLSVITNLLEARLVCGDPEQLEQLRGKLRAPRVWPARDFFAAKLKEQEARHLRYGDTAYNLEPNVKEGAGGLRDLHMISWVTNRCFGAGNLAELVQQGFLTDLEYRSLIRGRDFLWRLRNGLHLLSGRCEDRLLFDYQRELASQLGYRRGQNHLAVEQMMKRYYRTVKELRLLNELLLQHFSEAVLAPRKPRAANINPRFRRVGDFLEAADESVFQRAPNAILEMFHLLQQHPRLKGVRASTIRQLRANLHRIDPDYRRQAANRRMFLDIFRHQDGLTHALRRMNRYGVLGAFFPEFGEIIGQMQHDLFHVYTVDAHSLFVVRNLRRLTVERHRHEFPLLSELLTKQPRRERLYLAALCHDIGKGSGRDHSEVGARIALSLCTRLGLSEYDARFVAWLVRHHLLMSSTAQRQDPSDPAVIDRFAEAVGDQEHLDNLYLLTVADIRGTSPKVWNEWKGQLLANLYTATSRRLRTGIAGAEAARQRIEARQAAVRKLTAGKVAAAALEQLWGQLGDEYFLRNGPESGAWHAEQITRAGLLDLPLVAARHREEIAAQQILVLAPESENLLPRITAGLDKLHLDIFDARIHQTRSGLALLVFIAVDPAGAPANAQTITENSAKLKEFVLSPPASYRPVSRLLSRALKQFRVPTTVTFGGDGGGGGGGRARYTTMEVIAQDRPGLLYHVSLALLECKVRLISAKVSTVGEKAEDTFFITDRDGAPVDSEAVRDCLRRRLQRSLAPLGDQ